MIDGDDGRSGLPGSGRALVAEFLGTAGLLAAIVGSGITASVDGPASAQLFAHAVVVGVALTALIYAFGPVSGAHFNPAVTAVDWWFGGMSGVRALAYVATQLTGALFGTIATHVSFSLPAAEVATLPRDGIGLAVGEAFATGGLILVIFGLIRTGRTAAVPAVVGAWIGAAVYFTSSAAFANPAVTVARMVTETYTSIAPASVPGFLAGQVVGAAGAAVLVWWLYDPDPREAQDLLVPRDSSTGE